MAVENIQISRQKNCEIARMTMMKFSSFSPFAILYFFGGKFEYF
jgi:hypothetical protein